MGSNAHSAKVVELNPWDDFRVGDEVYLNEDYYQDTKATVLEVPKYGWKVKSTIDDVVNIEYQRPNLKLLMSLMIETRYLKKEA